MENYKEIFTCTYGGGFGHIGLKILVDSNIDIDFKNDAFNEIYKLCNAIPNEILAANLQISEKAQSEKIKQKTELIGLFNSPIFVEEIPNGYCSSWCCRHLPWYVVTTTVGRFTIGWRKRVINIDWSNTINTKKADELFKSIETTKGEKYIHAWSLEDAKHFIDKILTDRS